MNEPPVSPAWRLLCRVGLSLTIFFLCSCYAAHERRMAGTLRAQGDLRGAHEVLNKLVTEGADQPGDRAELAILNRELAALATRSARDWLAAGWIGLALRDLALALQYEPGCAAASTLAHRIVSEWRTHEDWRQRYYSAVDAERWAEALALLEDPGTPLFPQRHRGRWADLAARAWGSLFEARDHTDPADLARHAALLGAAEELADRHRLPLIAAGVPFEDALAAWRHARRAQEVLITCRRRLADLEAAGDWTAALHEARQARALVPDCRALPATILRLRERAAAAAHETLREAAGRRDARAALAAWRELQRHAPGQPPPSGIVIPTLEQLRAQELHETARAAERLGHLACALLDYLQAQQFDATLPEVVSSVARLRSELRARPLVEVCEPRVLTPVAPTVVEVGEPVFHEERQARVRHHRAGVRATGLTQSLNPSHQVEQAQWIATRAQATALHEAWQAAAPDARTTAQTRYEIAARAEQRCRQRLQELSTWELRSTWSQDPDPVEVRELTASLRMPVRILRRNGGATMPEDLEITAHMQLVDRTRAADPARGIPGDPEDLPSPARARAQLEADCARQLRGLLERLALETRTELLAVARDAPPGSPAQVEPAVWVILSAPGHSDPLRRAALELLERSGGWASTCLQAL